MNVDDGGRLRPPHEDAEKLVFYFDFDGTITQQDYIVPFMTEFLDGDWAGLDELYFRGEIGRLDLYRRLFVRMRGARSEHLAYIRQYGSLDEGFIPLRKWLQKNAFDLAILSDGIHMAVDALLKQAAVDIPIFSNHVVYNDAGTQIVGIEPEQASKNCRWCSNCKRRILLERADAQFVVFSGDGISDVCAVEEAELVFARDMLTEICREKKIPCIAFTRLSSIHSFCEELAAGPVKFTPELFERHGLVWHGSMEQQKFVSKFSNLLQKKEYGTSKN